MAQEKKQSKPVTLYSPKGARVSVSEEKADRFQAIGYRKTKPKAAAKPAEVDVDALRAEIRAEVDVDALRAEIRAEVEAEQAEATAKAPEKK